MTDEEAIHYLELVRNSSIFQPEIRTAVSIAIGSLRADKVRKGVVRE